MDSIEQNRCNSGLVRCVFKNATCSGTGRPCVYGAVDVELALAVSSDAFFYRIGELIMVENDYEPILQEQVRLFGFGADTGIDLPFEFDGTVPDKELKARYAELGVISRRRGVGLFHGRQRAARHRPGLAVGVAAPARERLRDHRKRRLRAPARNHQGDLRARRARRRRGGLRRPRTSPFRGRAEPARRSRSTAPDVGGDRRRDHPRSATSDHRTGHRQRLLPLDDGGEAVLHVPVTAIPVAGKTGTAQGAGNYPWNDSSAFAAYSTDPERPFTVSAYLEKSGYGSQAAAPS